MNSNHSLISFFLTKSHVMTYLCKIGANFKPGKDNFKIETGGSASGMSASKGGSASGGSASG